MHGRVTAFESTFLDPKPDLLAARQVLTSSWVDSGINAMSVLARFVELESLTTSNGSSSATCQATLRFRGASGTGEGSITTDWSATGMVKATRLTFEDGAVLALRHLAQEAALECSRGVTLLNVGGVGPPSAERYRAMIEAYLGEDPSVPGQGLTVALHEFLAEGCSSPS